MSFNFKTVMGSSSYRQWKKWAEGDYLVGKYVSQSEDQYGKPNYKVEVIEGQFEDGTTPKVGSMFTFNSSGALNKAMDEISEGDIIKVIYKGEDTITKGKYKGKSFHSMEVLVAPANGSAPVTTSSMEEVSEGDIIKAIYKGEDTVTKGKYKGKSFHSMEVLVAPANGSAPVTTSSDEDLI